MKTFFKVLCVFALLLIPLFFFICSRINAQTIISIGSSSDTALVMKIKDQNRDEQFQKLIIIIDSSLMTYGLSENEVYALSDMEYHEPFPVVVRQGVRTEKKSNQEELLDFLSEKTLKEEADREDDLELQEWMYSLKEWLENGEE